MQGRRVLVRDKNPRKSAGGIENTGYRPGVVTEKAEYY
jgi:hypothetical protein